ncbi:MAG: hypothetical protein DRJ56_07420 [Thermoprotei archaeon]|nr:MAG: hypothetical protein DRJ56_07420 [Thermoprotei archaeon]
MRAEDLIDEFLKANRLEEPEIEIVEDYTVEGAYDPVRDLIFVPDPEHAFITFLAHEMGHRILLRSSRFYRTWVLNRAVLVKLFWLLMFASFASGLMGVHMGLAILKTTSLILFFVWLAFGLIFMVIDNRNERKADELGYALYERWLLRRRAMKQKPRGIPRPEEP